MVARVLLCLVLVGCVDSSSVQCGFGLCPPGSTCDEPGKRCVPPTCGNHTVESLEQCDGTTLAGADCTSVAGFYNPAGLTCTADCTFDTSACGGGQCGDDKVNGPELCDGLPPIGASCIDFGYDLGKLGCTVDCSIGVQGCYRIGWHPGQGTASDDLHAVWGASQAEVWGVGASGQILRGSGNVWEQVASPTTNDLNGIWGTGAKDIFAVGDAGTILHYDGTAWTPTTSNTTANLHAINGTPTDMWIVGDGGTILHSPTGSAAWTAEASGTTVGLRGVWAQNAMTAVAVGQAATTGSANPTALYRNNGVWTPLTTPTIQAPAGTTVSLEGVWGQGTAYVAVGTATTATNRGSVLQVNLAASTTFTFTGQAITSHDLRSVWGVATNRTDIYIGGLFGTLLHYTGVPGSAHFYAYNSNTTRSINGLWGTGPAFVRAATSSGEVQEYNGTDLSGEDLSTLGPTPALQTKQMNAVWFDPTTATALAVGDSGYISRHDNTGWSTPTQLTAGGPFNAVWGSGTTIVIGGNGSQGLQTSTNSGTNFGTPALTSFNWQSIWGTSATDIYAVGSSTTALTGAIAHYNGTWTQLPDVGTTRLDGIWGTSDSDIFVVGFAGQIYHYNGTAWTAQDSKTTEQLNAIWGSATNDVYAVGMAGTILHYDGTTWHKLTSGTAQDLYAVGGSSRADVFVAGRGVVLHSSGLGAFQPMEATLADIYGVFAQPDAIYFVGDVATIAATNAGAAVLTRTVLGMVEGICNDPWDNDVDGKVDCADEDCADTFGCKAGGTCAPALPLSCGSTESSTTYTGIARIDDLPCLDHSTPGPEASYRLVADHDGTITVTIDAQSALDLVVLNSWDDQSVTTNRRIACDVTHCTAAPSATGSRTVSFPAKTGETYYLLVDGPLNTADAFTLDVSCP